MKLNIRCSIFIYTARSKRLRKLGLVYFDMSTTGLGAVS